MNPRGKRVTNMKRASVSCGMPAGSLSSTSVPNWVGRAEEISENTKNFPNLRKNHTSTDPRNIMNSPKWHEHKEIHTQALHSKKKKMLERQRKNLKKQQEKNDSIVLRIPVRLTDFGYWKQRRPEAELWMAYSKS